MTVKSNVTDILAARCNSAQDVGRTIFRTIINQNHFIVPEVFPENVCRRVHEFFYRGGTVVHGHHDGDNEVLCYIAALGHAVATVVLEGDHSTKKQ